MNLLLLLSALLSALAGVGSRMPAPGVAHSVVARSVAPIAVAGRRQTVSARPVAALPSLAAMAGLLARVTVPIVTTAPLWASRRRE